MAKTEIILCWSKPLFGSYWFIGCSLPPSSGIVSYYVNEQQ